MKKMKPIVRKYAFLLAILALGCNADLHTKNWAEERLKFNYPVEIIPHFFELRYAENNAMAFSMMHQLKDAIRLPLIYALTILALLFIVLWIWKWRRRKLIELLPLILILSGALGNIVDRISKGYVVDFIYFHYGYQFSFPIFNLADILVFSGVVLLLLQNWRKRENVRERAIHP